jgi:hypothetical protein
LNINTSIQNCTNNLDKNIDGNLNKSHEDSQKILDIQRLEKNVYNEVSLDDKNAHIIQEEIVYNMNQLKPPNSVNKLKSQYDNNNKMMKTFYDNNNDNNKNKNNSDNDKTLEFQSPIKKTYYTSNQKTEPRYDINSKNDNNMSTVYDGTRNLNISDIPAVDSASDRSSPLICSPSEEEKRVSPVAPVSNTPKSVKYPAVDGTAHEEKSYMGGGYEEKNYMGGVEIEALRLRCKQLSEIAENEKIESNRFRKQVVTLQEELEESMYTSEKNSHNMRIKEKSIQQAFEVEMNSKILQVENEKNLLHEANVRAAHDQYLREIGGLRGELMNERKTYVIHVYASRMLTYICTLVFVFMHFFAKISTHIYTCREQIDIHIYVYTYIYRYTSIYIYFHNVFIHTYVSRIVMEIS